MQGWPLFLVFFASQPNLVEFHFDEAGDSLNLSWWGIVLAAFPATVPYRAQAKALEQPGRFYLHAY